MKRMLLLILAIGILLYLPGCCCISILPGDDAVPSSLPSPSIPETEYTTAPTQMSTEATLPQVDSTHYLDLYSGILEDYKTVVRYRFSRDFYENWDFDVGVPGISNALKNSIFEGDLDGSWTNTVFELPDSTAAQSADYYGYILHDLNADSVPELFWVRMDHSIIAVFTWYNDHPVLLDSYYSRYRGFVSQNNSLFASGSSGASSSQCYIYTLKQGKLEATRAFFSEASQTGEVEYFELDANGATLISATRFEELSAMYPSKESQYWKSLPIHALGIEVLPESKEPYLQKIRRADQTIWSGPGYDNFCVDTVGTPGTFTIVEEATDGDGNLWGKLKSGAGWVDLTQIRADTGEDPVLTAEFTNGQLPEDGNYHHCIADTSEYMVQVTLRIDCTVTNVSLCEVVYLDYGEEYVDIFHISKWDPRDAFVADIAFPGDMSSYLIRFTDSAGVIHAYQIYTSGKDGSLVLSPLTP